MRTDIDVWPRVAEVVCKILYHDACKRVVFENAEALSKCIGQPTIIHAKHQHWYDDPVLGGMVYHFMQQVPWTIGKSSMRPLAFWERAAYLLPVERQKDTEVRDSASPWSLLLRAGIAIDDLIHNVPTDRGGINKRTFEKLVPEILTAGGVIQVHDEGRRNYQEEGIINKNSIRHLLQSQEIAGVAVNHFAVDFKYLLDYKPRFRPPRDSIKVIIYDPIQVPDHGDEQLMDYLRSNITLFK